MIKINLLLDSAGSGAVVQDAGGAGLANTDEEKRDLGVKLIILIIPVILFYIYNFYTSTIMRSEVNKLQAEVTASKDKLRTLDPDVKEIEKFQEEKRKLDSQLDVIRKLSKERLKNVKSLDALQEIIPQRAWLSDLKFTENKVELAGFATDDIVISDFMQALESSIYFANVTLQASTEEKRDAGVVKKFVIKCNLENL